MESLEQELPLASFGEWVRRRRKGLDLTQRVLAEEISCATVTIQKIEADERRPSLDLAQLLAERLDIPEAQRELFLRVARAEVAVHHLGSPSPAILAQPPSPGAPPYQGLRQFEEADAPRFFGREELTPRLVERLDEHPFLAVIGRSGSGKSSLLRAGLIPLLRAQVGDGGQENDILLMTPTARPLQALATALTRDTPSLVATTRLIDDLLADPRCLLVATERRSHARDGSRLTLIIDQFEECFTLCDHEEERRAFIDGLVHAAAPDAGMPVRIAIAMRADFYAQCAPYPTLRALVSSHQLYIGAMDEAECRSAIEGPAAAGGWTFEEELVALILDDVGSEPGRLPLLSHVLLETWERRSGRTMTLAGYRAAGGVRGALSRTADRVLRDELEPEEQEVARRIFLQLTEPGEDAPDTRRRVPLEQLSPTAGSPAVVDRVLQRLADARLVTIGSEVVEIAHEALIREWPTLRDWLDESREALRVGRHVDSAARAWEELGREAEELYRGTRLVRALSWAEAHDDFLSPLARDFLAAARTQMEREATAEEERRLRELEAAQRVAAAERARAAQEATAAAALRRRAYYLLVAFGMAALLAGAALIQFRTAQQEARVAVSRELAVAAINNLDVDPERSILLALEALQRAPTLEGEDALHRALAATRVERLLEGHDGLVTGVVFSPDGTRTATSGVDGTLRMWDVESGAALVVVTAHESPINSLAWSPDGSLLATASEDGSAALWEATTVRLHARLPHPAPVENVAFSPDGGRVATVADDGVARLWESAAGAPIRSLAAADVPLLGVRFSPDGTRLLTTSARSTATLWDLDRGEVTQTIEVLLPSGIQQLYDAAFSPDGRRIAIADSEKVTVWDLDREERLYALLGHANIVTEVHFTPDGHRLITSSADGSARLWDAATARELMEFVGHPSPVAAVALSADGTRLATAALDGSARLWNARSYTWEHATLAHDDGVGGMDFHPDGSLLATGSEDRFIRLWDPATGALVRVLEGYPGRVFEVTFNPDGTRLASAGEDGTVRLWDPTTGEEVRRIAAHGGALRYGGFLGGALFVDFGPDGQRLASAGADGAAHLWSVADGERLLSVRHEQGGIAKVLITPDGERWITAGEDGSVRVWDLDDGELLMRLERPTTLWGLALSPDGRRIAASDLSGTAIWDAASGDLIVEISGYGGVVDGLAFSPDGALLAGAANDGTTHLWESATGRERLQLTGPLRTVFTVAFSPDGRHLVSGSVDGTARIYVLPTDELIALARGRLTRGLTGEECRRFLHLPACPASN